MNIGVNKPTVRTCS